MCDMTVVKAYLANGVGVFYLELSKRAHLFVLLLQLDRLCLWQMLIFSLLVYTADIPCYIFLIKTFNATSCMIVCLINSHISIYPSLSTFIEVSTTSPEPHPHPHPQAQPQSP